MLYTGYRMEVWRYVARAVGPQAAAVQDIVQEVFISAARSARQFDPQRGRLWDWLFGIARFHVVAHWRQTARRVRLMKAVTETVDVLHLFDAGQSLQEICDCREIAEIVRFVLSELPDEYAELLTVRYVDELGLAEISNRFGGSVEAVKSKLARARREFREKFEFVIREPSPVGNS